MTWGNINQGGSGYYCFGGQLIYFDETPTEEEVLKKLAEIEAASYSAPHIDCGGACCADQPKIIN